MLSGISVICFAASYAIALALDVSRLFGGGGFRNALMIGFAATGFVAHTLFLAFQMQQRWAAAQPLLTWFTGCLAFAWILVLACLSTYLLQRKSTAGLLLFPTSLVLIIAAHLFPSTERGVLIWNRLHGMSLLVGMALVVIGFSAGLLYLVQSYRLKHKLPPLRTIWLPSLERLQNINERCLLASVMMLGVGLISGILLNLVRIGSSVLIPWSDPVVVASLVWLAWLLAVAIFQSLYRPARQGRKVAYMTIISFVFLSLVLAIIWWMPSRHTRELDGRGLAFSPIVVRRSLARRRAGPRVHSGRRTSWDESGRLGRPVQ